jgi:uncharacterized protein (TIGR02231 family)
VEIGGRVEMTESDSDSNSDSNSNSNSNSNRASTFRAPIVVVTLLEDRAHVVRRGLMNLKAGATRARIEDVAPVLSDKTLSVELVTHRESARVADAWVRRRRVVRLKDGLEGQASETARAKLERELDLLNGKLEREESERRLLDERAKRLDEIARHSFSDLASDVSWGRAIKPEWMERFAELREKERELRRRLVALNIELRDLSGDRERLRERIRALDNDNPSELETAAIEIELQSEDEGDCEIRIDYVVPCACWRPYHTAQLEPENGDKVLFSTDACVWQATGEDWVDAALVFSTERASLGSEPPELVSDRLALRPKSERVQVAERETKITSVVLGGTGVRSLEASELPGIDDGGEPQSLRAARKSSIPSDGRPYRVRLSTFETECEGELVAFPELLPTVQFKTVQSNAGPGPILAGPVDLIRRSGLCGRTSVSFHASGERFELGWGPDPELRVQRSDEQTKEKSRTLSSWFDRKHEIEIRLSNLGNSPKALRVTERVPVSEVDKVKIAFNSAETSEGVRPDENGFVSWSVSLPPNGQKSLALSYKLSKHHEVEGI